MTGKIVVGVDGSDSSKKALRWALEESRLSGSKLEVVTAWETPLVGGFPGVTVPVELPEKLEEAAGELVSSLVKEAVGDTTPAGLEQRALEGDAADVLIKESKDAALLVVGSRGLGGFRELLLGSVSQQCSSHAHCPVVVVRGESSN
jgi:nucleotide-binding universal stress UspA family protein